MAIELTLGPLTHMQSDALAKRYALDRKVFGCTALIITHHADDDVTVGTMTGHDYTLPCLRTRNLMQVDAVFDTVHIHNAHFFNDLKEYVLKQHGRGRNCYVYAADSDHLQCKVGQIWDLIPYAHHIAKPLVVCANPQCLQYATCTMKLGERFIAVCHKCLR